MKSTMQIEILSKTHPNVVTRCIYKAIYQHRIFGNDNGVFMHNMGVLRAEQ